MSPVNCSNRRLDTREKIVASETLCHGGVSRCKLVIGYFDPLQADHIRRLSEVRRFGERLVVAVAEPAEPLLPLLARAELVASLRGVDQVIPVGGKIEDVIQALSPDEVVDERDADRVRSAELMAHVVRRHRDA